MAERSDKANRNSGATVGYEARLWQMADALLTEQRWVGSA
jgi:hypothetical protein